MKIIKFAAVLVGATQACQLENDYYSHLPQDFMDYQMNNFIEYDQYCQQQGKPNEMTQYTYDPYGPQQSKYAYSDYIPGENPYLGRWAAGPQQQRF